MKISTTFLEAFIEVYGIIEIVNEFPYNFSPTQMPMTIKESFDE